MKITTQTVMKQLDQWVNNHSWWAKGYVPANRVTADYTDKPTPIKVAPAIQQVRAEIEELIGVIIKRKLTGGTILEIGMGITGGTHKLWTMLAKRVVTIELYRERIDRHIAKEKPDHKQSFFINGSSTDALVIMQAQHLADKCDVLFIDGDHSFTAVSKDYRNYQNLVRKGGIIVFHDTILSNGGNIDVKEFLDSTFTSSRYKNPYNSKKAIDIHNSRCVGISYIVV